MCLSWPNCTEYLFARVEMIPLMGKITEPGELSTSASPMLASDPHLPATSPSIWHITHLSTKEFRVCDPSSVHRDAQMDEWYKVTPHVIPFNESSIASASRSILVMNPLPVSLTLSGFAQRVLVLGFLCATSVSSVSLWCGFTRN